MIAQGLKLLRSRYRLLAGPLVKDAVSQSWVGVDDEDSKYLLKLWPFEGDSPDDLQRALWDAELRTLYRVGSSPGADAAILVVRDAGVDREAHCFAMVIQGQGYEPLSGFLPGRSQIPWLSVKDVQARRALWQGLEQLAEGIRLLHEQHVLHRNVVPETVFLDSLIGPSSFRLGGFEWSVRLGTPETKAPPPGWSSPPEFFAGRSYGYRPESDWYAFGMLIARLMLNVEGHGFAEPVARHARVLGEIEGSSGRLSDLERAFLLRMVANDPRERIARSYEVLSTIRDIIRALDQGGDPASDQRPLVVVVNPMASQDLVDKAISDYGFVPNVEKPQDPFNPRDILHAANLTSFLQQDLATPQLYAVPGKQFYLLAGAQFVLRLLPFEYVDKATDATVRNWNLAFCSGLSELWSNDGGNSCVQLPPGGVVVRTRRQILRDSAIRQNSRSWQRHLPTVDRTVQLRASLARFHEFIRCTNQLELLLRDSEIFSYRVVDSSSVSGAERLVIEERPRNRRPVSFAAVEGGLCQFLMTEIESNKPDCRLVVLTAPGEDGLMLPQVQKTDAWTVDRVDPSDNRVELQRVSAGAAARSVTPEGHIRTWGMFGQVALVRRRKRAIDRIERHAYLLRSLSAPGQVYMDTGSMEQLPVQLSPDLVDEAKQAVIEDILRVRPIYALQGPPGTGKTTLVAHLLRQIFEDDPVAQVLITAQAHGAVDVLRAKVRDEAFQGISEEHQPLAVRLGMPTDGVQVEEGSVEDVSLRVLETAQRRLDALPTRSSRQTEWYAAIGEMLRALRTLTPGGTAPDFCEVVKRGANITYCTTSAGDLEVLADATQSFDWAIVEEAGKAHGFDLALPLQAGHRWLLIGDHKQLPPYRFKDYHDGIDRLEDAIQALEDLPERAGNLLDSEWARSWRERSPEERSEFKEYARRWLATFQRVFEYCSVATGISKLTLDRAEGAAAGQLSRQHRMHPTIGDLISTAYYDDVLVNRTLDDAGKPLARVIHPFVIPSGIESRAVIWINTPWAARESSAAEVGPAVGKPRYTNPAEVRALASFIRALRHSGNDPGRALAFAILSPYNQQVARINRELSDALVEHSLLVPKEGLRSRRRQGVEAPSRLAHSVDSFQGNQADVIAVSLVRNNTLPPGSGLGFLEDASRINVLLSRAERLLVLVGSWEFFRAQVAAVDLDDKQLPLWHWKKVLTTLEEWFGTGRAYRIEAEDLQQVALPPVSEPM